MTEKVPQLEESWLSVLGNEFSEPYFQDLKQFLISEKQQYPVYPPGSLIFEAFNRTPFDKLKVVLLGQDPYHGAGQAHGMCFSVPFGVKPPPSLENIFKELSSDLGLKIPNHGNLTKWAEQGVLLLNATLTVRANLAGSHQNKGWEQFTDKAISALSEQQEGIVFLLWGSYAQAKDKLIDESKHYILKAPHPSPLSVYRGFYGCKHFSKTNEILFETNRQPIDWQLEDV
jgi:uracil-DNA glycosylase